MGEAQHSRVKHNSTSLVPPPLTSPPRCHGCVEQAIDKRDGSSCAVKIMKPVKEHRLRREIKILRHLAGAPHVIRLLEVLRDPDTKTPCFAFDLVNATNFR